MSTKTNKSFTKRLEVTKNGKIIARSTGQQHRHTTTRSARCQMAKNRSAEWPISNKDRAHYIKN